MFLCPVPPPQGSAGWGAGPGAPGAPPVAIQAPHGLEYLTQVDQLLVKQKVEALEGIVTFLLYGLLHWFVLFNKG